jgi:hypothetical protein
MSSKFITLESPHYSARLDPGQKLVEIVLRGHWTVDIARSYERDFRSALDELAQRGCPLGEQATLIDITGFGVQPQDVAAQLELFAADQSIAPRRTAMVVSTMLLKLQARRVAPDYRIFDNRDEALAWLTEPVENPRSA